MALKIGIILPSLRMETKAALHKAAELGADGVQLWVAGGELDPRELTVTGKRELLDTLARLGLEISAICGDLGKGFTDPQTVAWSIERTKEMLQLGQELGAPILTTHIGVIPDDRSSLEWHTLTDAMLELGSYAARLGGCLATETGPESPQLMFAFLEMLNTGGVAVNYDPANLVMNNFDPVAGLRVLGSYVVHTHAKDGIRYPDGTTREVPLGEGQVPWEEYITTLRSVGFSGYLTIEREVGEDPVADIAKAIGFLRPYAG